MSKRVEIPSDGRKQEHSLLITEEEPPGQLLRRVFLSLSPSIRHENGSLKKLFFNVYFAFQAILSILFFFMKSFIFLVGTTKGGGPIP